MRTIYIGNSTLMKGDEAHALEYSVIASDLLSEDLKPVGESYGVRVRMTAPIQEGKLLNWKEWDMVRDITTKQEEIVDFVLNLSKLQVTPVSLRDVVYDALPL